MDVLPATQANPMVTFVAAVAFIETDSDLRNGIRIGDALVLVSDPNRIAVLKQAWLKSSLGSMEIGHILRSRLVATGEIEAPKSDEARERLAFVMGEWLITYLERLWVLRDCSPFVEQCFLIDANSTHANRTLRSYSTADGTRRKVLFTRKELSSARIHMPAMSGLPAEQLASTEVDWWRSRDSLSGRESTRWSRFLGFVAAARETHDLGLKVAHYTSALEALLSTGTSELRHILSERVALLSPAERRLEAYRMVQQIYDQRSRVLHGSAIGKSVDLRTMAKHADDVARQVAAMYVENDAFRTAVSDDARLANYFLTGLLGAKS